MSVEEKIDDFHHLLLIQQNQLDAGVRLEYDAVELCKWLSPVLINNLGGRAVHLAGTVFLPNMTADGRLLDGHHLSPYPLLGYTNGVQAVPESRLHDDGHPDRMVLGYSLRWQDTKRDDFLEYSATRPLAFGPVTESRLVLASRLVPSLAEIVPEPDDETANAILEYIEGADQPNLPAIANLFKHLHSQSELSVEYYQSFLNQRLPIAHFDVALATGQIYNSRDSQFQAMLDSADFTFNDHVTASRLEFIPDINDLCLVMEGSDCSRAMFFPIGQITRLELVRNDSPDAEA